MTPKIDWRPIDSAPIDGRRVLLWDGEQHYVGYWGLTTWVTEPCGWMVVPTHWQPLPEPPEVNDGTD